MENSDATDQFANARIVSPRWVTWRERTKIADYEQRFAQLEARGTAMHGEADFIERFQPRHCLDAGCGTGRVAIELAKRGVLVTGVDLDADMLAAAKHKAPQLDWSVQNLATMTLGKLFDVVAMAGNVMIFCLPADRGAIVTNLVAHLEPSGTLIAGFSLERNGYSLAEWDEDCEQAGLSMQQRFSTWEGGEWTPADTYHVSVHVRI